MSKKILIFIFISINSILNAQIELFGEVVPTHSEYVRNKLKATIKQFKRMGITPKTLKQRADKLFPIYDKILSKYNVPKDFKYLSVIESGLNPMATSQVGAKGLWQFMPQTAKGMGMVVNDRVDERINIYTSTENACIYLLQNKKYLGSWILSAASYNCGAGCINNSIRKSKTKNYFSMTLNKETSDYIYRIAAAKLLFEEYENQGKEYKETEGKESIDTIKNIIISSKQDVKIEKKELETKIVSEIKLQIQSEYMDLENPKLKMKIINENTYISTGIINVDCSIDTIENRLYLNYNFIYNNEFYCIKAIDKDDNMGLSIPDLIIEEKKIYFSRKKIEAKIINYL
jgi:membrane-bound lytic murein transglycosylase D